MLISLATNLERLSSYCGPADYVMRRRFGTQLLKHRDYTQNRVNERNRLFTTSEHEGFLRYNLGQ